MMKKDKKDLPKGISFRSDGRYQGRITHHGKRYTLYAGSVKELQKKMQNLQYELDHGIYVTEENLSIEVWFDTWLRVYKINNVKIGTINTYKQCFEKYIQPILGKLKIKDIRPEQIQNLYNDMKDKGYAVATIDLVSIILSSMFKQATKNEIIKKNPVLYTTKPKDRKRTEKKAMTMEEQQLFMKYVDLSQYNNIYKIALYTGARAGELRALEWKDVDFKSRTINIRGTLKYVRGNGYYKDTPKTISSERTIPMLEGVYNFFKDEKKKQSNNRIKNVNIYKKNPGLEDLVFTTEIGQPVSHDALNVNLKKLIKLINQKESEFGSNNSIITKITPHTLRHTFATRGLENGIAPKVMQDMLGHSSITMTLDLYSHVLPDMKSREIKKLENLL